ncbi:MAG: gliding motility protein GldM [Paludibacter sp.]|nr:gliding motility protein GldM [Paludibacter sp.]
MASSKNETPRQKMIGMMYLVLTALLALNVSKEVLEGYSVVNNSVMLTNSAYASKRDEIYARIERDYSLNQKKVGPYLEKSKIAKRISTEMVQYIENLRNELIAETENIPIDSARNISVLDLKNKDNYTIPTNFLIGINEDGSNGRANVLKKRIKEYRETLLNLIDPKNRDKIKIGLETEGKYYNTNGVQQNWECHYFYDIPLAADVPILNKFITEVNNAEQEVLEGLLREMSAGDYRYDKIAARILPKTNFLFTGDEYEAEVIVAAYDTSQTPNVYLMRGVDSLPIAMKDKATQITGQNGHINFKFPANATGIEKFAGFVSVRNNSGDENTYHFNSEYFVAKPSLTVSATNMNVLYVGVNNPLSISVAGIPAENIYPTISIGTLKQDKLRGGWTATVPPTVNETRIDVSLKTNGLQKKMGSAIFRVKKLPNPAPYIALAKNGFVSRENLIIAGKIIPKMPADFEFDYTFDILSFTMTMQRGFNTYNYESDNNKLTDEMIKQIRNTNRGQVIIFEDIIARGPDGSNRELTPLIITIN